MHDRLQISTRLSLPPDTVTSTVIVYGGKGQGKTNFAAVMCEEVAKAGGRFSFIDPLGVSWGLRHSSDGAGKGIEVLILGGKHGDLPIEPTGGAVVADLVVDESVNVIIDISRHPDGRMWGIGERIRFVADYCNRLYERQGERMRPILQIIDEAGRFCPQDIRKDNQDAARCVNAVATMTEEGRNVGIGVMLITQRSARMNKAVSELADAMIAFRTVGPRSIDAIDDWLGEHCDKDKRKGFIVQLRELERGTALVVSPGWLQYEGIVPMRARRTFDSSATPTGGKEVRASGRGAVVDLRRYAELMKETVERAKANDPKALKRRVEELEEQLGKAAVDAGDSVSSDEFSGALVDEYQRGYREGFVGGQSDIRQVAIDQLEDFRAAIEKLPPVDIQPLRAQTPVRVATPVEPRKVPIVVPDTTRPPGGNGDGMPKVERVFLTVLAQRSRAGKTTTRDQVAIFAKYSVRSRHVDNALSALRVKGYIDGRGEIAITRDGLAALGSFEPMPTGKALLAQWLGTLSAAPAAMLRVLASCYPKSMTRNEIAEATSYSPASRHVDNSLSELRSKQLIDGRGDIRASKDFFERG